MTASRLQAPVGNAAVNRYLLPSESRSLVFRNHPSIMFPAIVEALSSLAVVLVLNGTLAHSFGLKLVIFIPLAYIWARMVYIALSWLVNFTAITEKRFLIITGIITRKVTVIPLDQLTDLGIERHFSGRLLGHGTLVTYSGGAKRVLASQVPHPEQIFLEMAGELYKDKDGHQGAYHIGADGPDVDYDS
jgi:hypothetical protein